MGPEYSLVEIDLLVPAGSEWFAFALLLMVFQPPYPVIALAAVCLGFATGGLLPVWNSMMALVFGADSFGRAMGAMAPMMTMLVMPAYILIGRLHDLHGNYTTSLAVFCVLTVLAILLLIPVRLPTTGHG